MTLEMIVLDIIVMTATTIEMTVLAMMRRTMVAIAGYDRDDAGDARN